MSEKNKKISPTKRNHHILNIHGVIVFSFSLLTVLLIGVTVILADAWVLHFEAPRNSTTIFYPIQWESDPCRAINSSINYDYFVPAKTEAEWSAVKGPGKPADLAFQCSPTMAYCNDVLYNPATHKCCGGGWQTGFVCGLSQSCCIENIASSYLSMMCTQGRLQQQKRFVFVKTALAADVPGGVIPKCYSPGDLLQEQYTCEFQAVSCSCQRDDCMGNCTSFNNKFDCFTHNCCSGAGGGGGTPIN